MNRTLRNFARFLDEKNISYKLLPDSENVIVIQQTLQENHSVLVTLFISFDNETTNVQISIYGLGRVNSINIDTLRLINNLNADYNTYKFYIDVESGQIVMMVDLFPTDIDGNEVIFGASLKGLFIADACYPRIMRLLWG